MSDGVMSDGEWWPAWHMLPKKIHLKHATRVYDTQSQRMQRAVRPHARIGDTQLNVAKLWLLLLKLLDDRMKDESLTGDTW